MNVVRMDTVPHDQGGPLRGGTVDYVVESLRVGLLNGRFAPGQRLIEADLTRELGVSRGPLREAFRRLSAEGLVETVPHRGAVVRRLTAREMRELFQIRVELEMLAARLAADATRDPSIRARFEAEVAVIWQDGPRSVGPSYIEENHRFHDAVVSAGGNEQLLRLTRQLRLPLLLYQATEILTPNDIMRSVEEHRRIAQAILRNDAVDAAEQARAHLTRALLLVERAPGGPFSRLRASG